MSLTASATTIANATPRELLEFVLDVDQYRAADHKITRVGSVEGPDEAGHGSVELWGRLRGLPPAPDRQDFKLERWSKLTFVGAPRQPGRLVFNFVGTFECDPVGDGGTRVTHAYEFTFRRAFRLIEKAQRDWLQTEVEAEVQRIAEIFENGPSA